jgi:hypothetical protein
MFQITEDPSSGSLVQGLAKNYKNDMDTIDSGTSFIYSELHTRTTGQNMLP